MQRFQAPKCAIKSASFPKTHNWKILMAIDERAHGPQVGLPHRGGECSVTQRKRMESDHERYDWLTHQTDSLI